MVERPARPDLCLEDLEPGAENDFVIGRLHDSLRFTDMNLVGESLHDRELVDCQVLSSVLDDAKLGRSRFRSTSFEDCRATSLDVAAGDFKDVQFANSRLGDLQLYDAQLRRVTFRDCRLGYLNLRSAGVIDLILVDCVIDEVDLRGARVKRLSLEGSSIKCLSVAGSELVDVDLRRASIDEVDQVSSLRGVTIGPDQLMEFAPALAAELGIHIA